MNKMFRLLSKEEVEVRVGNGNKEKTGNALLLYKNARADMAILDETVGPMNWSRNHEVIGGELYCSVGIKDEDGSWVFKSDVGTVSKTDPAKGAASDAFKRACVSWGIGRELYTAPFIWISPAPKAYDKFEISDIGYDEKGAINKLIIINVKTKAVVYNMKGNYNKNNNNSNNTESAVRVSGVSEAQINRLYAIAKSAGVSQESLLNQAKVVSKVDDLHKLSRDQYDKMCNALQKIADSKNVNEKIS